MSKLQVSSEKINSTPNFRIQLFLIGICDTYLLCTNSNLFRNSRLKCDQGKPSCGRCETKKKECSYPDSFRPVIITNLSPSPIKKSHITCSLASSLSSKLCTEAFSHLGTPIDTEERFYYYYFQHKVSVELSSLLPSTFWNQYVLPMSTSTLSIQHAIVALAAQHKSYADFGPIKPSSSDHGNVYQLLHYGRAIRALSCRIQTESDAAQIAQEALIACLLFISLNVLRGDDIAALMHLNSGLKIIKRLWESVNGSGGAAQSPCNEFCYQLVNTFKRLDLQAALFLGSHRISSVSKESGRRPHLPISNNYWQSFESLKEARHSLTEIVLAASDFMRRTAEPLKYLEADRQATRMKIDTALTKREAYMEQLLGWLHSFEAYLPSSLDGPKDVRERDASGCSMLYAYTMIALSVCLAPNETEYDNFSGLFLVILQTAEKILRPTPEPYSETPGLPRRTSKLFSLEMSTIQPLYYTALKCRDADIRHGAIALMHETGKEGVWDGIIMARIADHIVRLEECGNDESYTENKAPIKEKERVCGVAINISRKESKVWIQSCTRKRIASASNTKSLVVDGAVLSEEEMSYEYVWEFREDTLKW